MKIFYIIVATALFSQNCFAANKLSLSVLDSKSSKLKTKISMPIWAVKMGGSLINVLSANSQNIDFKKVLTQLEKQKKVGEFLRIQDSRKNETVLFSLE